MQKNLPARWCWLGAAGLSLLLACGCAALRPSTEPPATFYSLDSAPTGAQAVSQAPATARAEGFTLVVHPPRAAAGFDSQRIIYVRQAHRLEYYAHNEWIDTPARMLAPLIVAAIERSGAFRAVLLTPSTAAGDLRLETEVMRLQHEFLGRPSRVHFTLRANLVYNATRRVIASREFDAAAVSASEGPYGGVVAASRGGAKRAR